MFAQGTMELSPAGQGSDAPTQVRNKAPDVIVCVDHGQNPRAMIAHAKAVAEAFGAGVVLLSVIEPPEGGVQAVDPVDWEIRRRELRSRLDGLAAEFGTEDCPVTGKVLEGLPADQICRCVAEGKHDIVALSRAPGGGRWQASKVAGGAMMADVGAVFAVPDGAAELPAEPYRRILVPLDGSALAESAIPRAARLAKAHGAELVLTHVIPEPVLTEIGPADPETIRLKEEIERRNRSVASEYLGRVRDRLKDCEVPVATKLIRDGDTRRALVDAIVQEGADIVVMASHGQSAHADVVAGHVAGFILDRSTVPVLIVRQQRRHKDNHIFRDMRPQGIRHPVDLEK